MLGTRRRGGIPLEAHFIDAGRVGSPIRGRDVDLEQCYGCPALVGLGDPVDGLPGYVTCRQAPGGEVGALMLGFRR